jgi:hypothetical protein
VLKQPEPVPHPLVEALPAQLALDEVPPPREVPGSISCHFRASSAAGKDCTVQAGVSAGGVSWSDIGRPPAPPLPGDAAATRRSTVNSASYTARSAAARRRSRSSSIHGAGGASDQSPIDYEHNYQASLTEELAA